MTCSPRRLPPRGPRATATVTPLPGDLALAVFPTFQEPDAVDRVLARIAELRAGRTLRGVVIDVRANGGGRAEAVAKLLGAFTHGKAWAYNCDGDDRCTPTYTDDSVALLNIPLVVLTDGRCASACDAFSAAVRDLRLGALVGARTAGVVAGLPSRYRLDDDRFLELTGQYALGANREIVNDIGVAVDHLDVRHDEDDPPDRSVGEVGRVLEGPAEDGLLVQAEQVEAQALGDRRRALLRHDRRRLHDDDDDDSNDGEYDVEGLHGSPVT